MHTRSNHLRALSCAVLLNLVATASFSRSQAPSAQAEDHRDVASDVVVTYLANEGFLIEGGGKRVLIDALFAAGVKHYPSVPDDVRPLLEQGASPWNDIDLVLATHHHGDHFDGAAVLRFLRAQPRATFVSTHQAVSRLEALEGADEIRARVHGLLPPAGDVKRHTFDDIVVEVLNLHHGPRQPPVQNLGFVIHLAGQRITHFGDTEAKPVDFEPYLEPLADVDIAILPFWFMASNWRIGLVKDSLRPRSIIAAHVPLPSAPARYFGRWQSHARLLESMRQAFPDAHLPTTFGERYRFASEDASPRSEAGTTGKSVSTKRSPSSTTSKRQSPGWSTHGSSQ